MRECKMKHRLSFGFYNIFANNIIEVTADEGIEMTLEMVEECHEFVNNNVEGDFAFLINRINNYTYTYEAKLSVASYEGLKALAFVCYSEQSRLVTKKLQASRSFDQWEYPVFSGLELGWQQAYHWLENELSVIKIN
jgi:hypothetical protein